MAVITLLIITLVYISNAYNLNTVAIPLCAASPRVRCDGDAGQNTWWCHVCLANGAGLGNEIPFPGGRRIANNFAYYTRANAFCPQATPGTGAGAAGAVTIGNQVGEWVINWDATTPNGVTQPFEQEKWNRAIPQGMGLAVAAKRPIWSYFREQTNDDITTYSLHGQNPCAANQIAGICRYKIATTSHENLGRARSAAVHAKRQYHDMISEYEFDAMEAYNDLLADYEYDIAVEEARQNRVIQRLQAEKEEILRAKKKIKEVKARDNNNMVAIKSKYSNLYN